MHAPAGKYHLSLRILHWLMAVMMLSLVAVGFYMTGLEREDPLRGQLYALHKSFGVTVLGLFVLRLSLRLRHGAPPLPAIIPAYERVLAHLGHAALYLFMCVLPLSGIIMSNSFGLQVFWFGLPLPRLVGVDKDMGHLANDAHELLAFGLLALVALHAGAVLQHRLKDKLNLLKRMW